MQAYGAEREYCLQAAVNNMAGPFYYAASTPELYWRIKNTTCGDKSWFCVCIGVYTRNTQRSLWPRLFTRLSALLYSLQLVLSSSPSSGFLPCFIHLPVAFAFA